MRSATHDLGGDTEFVEIDEQETIHYNPLYSMFEAHRYTEASLISSKMYNKYVGKARRDTFLASLTPSEQKIFDEVAYPKGFKRIHQVSIDDLINRDMRKLEARNADSMSFLHRIRRNSQ